MNRSLVTGWGGKSPSVEEIVRTEETWYLRTAWSRGAGQGIQAEAFLSGLSFSHRKWVQVIRSPEGHIASDLFPGWVQMQWASLFPFPLSQGTGLGLPFPPRLSLLCFCPLLLAHHHDNQARLLPVGLGLSGR